MPADPNRNAWWCRLLARQLQRAGIAHLFVCPGNRNVPLVFAAARLDGWQIHVHQEERSAAFAALGIAKATGRPAAICTTSGSAVANCLPAVCEAAQSGLPLVVLSADRPPELHGCEAPQTIPQERVFGDFLDGQVLLPAPTDDATALAGLAERLQGWRGPVQINVPLRDPLPPLPDPAWTSPPDPEWAGAALPTPAPEPSPDPAAPPTALARPGLRGLIVAGPSCPLPRSVVDELATTTGYPVLADAPSGLRRPAVNNCIGHADTLCAGVARDWTAELVIRLGSAPIARPVYEFLQRQDCPVLRLDHRRVTRDFCHQAFSWSAAGDLAALRSFAAACRSGDPDWLARWHRAEDQAEAGRRSICRRGDWTEPQAVATVFARHRADHCHLGNSLAVRHGNLHLRPGPEPLGVSANRGVNGIDGTLGTLAGLCLAAPERHHLLLCGETTFLHDLPGLGLLASAARERGCSADIVVVNNRGGAIFDLLPVAGEADYRRLIRAPTSIDLAASAAQFDLDHVACTDHDGLTAALERTPAGARVIEIVLDDASLAGAWRELMGAMRGD